MKKLFFVPALALAIGISSCGNNSEKKEESTSTETTPSTETSAPAETVPGIEDVTLSNSWAIEGNDQMQYNINLMRVKAGEPVEITLKNVGSMPKESMGHNFVLLKPGVD
ncbi:MAG: plastocyanin/azurin family copper-binding protein, partial [Sphingobacterium sp.]